MLTIQKHEKPDEAVIRHKDYICAQTLANGLELTDKMNSPNAREAEIDKDVVTLILVERQL